MSKYNIHETKLKQAKYHADMSEKQKDKLYDRILSILMDDGLFTDPNFSASKLAKELDVHLQSVSVVFATCFHKSFPVYVNDCRIEYATSLLSDKKNKNINLALIGEMCGYGTMQCFYANFYRRMKCTPKEYRDNFFYKQSKVTL